MATQQFYLSAFVALATSYYGESSLEEPSENRTKFHFVQEIIKLWPSK